MDENANVTTNETTNDVVQPAPKAETSKADDKPTTQSAEDTIQQQMVEIAKLKRALDKASSDVADYKKKYNATLSEQERASQEKAEEQARRDERLAELERENSIHRFTESYLDLGYDKESAIAAATAQVDNDVETLFKLQKKILDEKVLAKEQELIKDMPRATTGKYASLTKEQIMAIPDREERRRAMAENFDLFDN
jgi:hypothetical protein